MTHRRRRALQLATSRTVAFAPARIRTLAAKICDRRHSGQSEIAAFLQYFRLHQKGIPDWGGFSGDCAVELSTNLMASTEMHPVYIVVGIRGNEIQYWAAAVSRRKAAREVANMLGPEWKTTVLDWRLTPERLAKLDLTRNGVRNIGIVEGLL